MEITGEERERKRESKTLLSIQNRNTFLTESIFIWIHYADVKYTITWNHFIN